MKFKIGVFGSATGVISSQTGDKAREIGKELSKKGIILITGACSGLPFEAAFEAFKNGLEIWGFSPEINYEEQKKANSKDNNNIYKKLVYVPENFPFLSDSNARKKYRNVISTATCDAGIIISGRWGTMNEFTNLHDMGKVIGILTDTGGIADELKNMSKKIHKPGKAKILFDNSPERLVQSVIKELEKRNEL